LAALPDGMVRWGARLTNVVRAGRGYELTFADGSTVITDVLIGADGARSKVRHLLSNAEPIYSGVSFVEARFFDADKNHPKAAALVGKGIMFALSDEKGLIAHREPDSELCIYVALKVPAEWSRTEVTREDLAAHFTDWTDDLRTLITGGEGDLAPRPIYALPTGHRWARLPGVTLVGDAAHLMSPFAGEGVNLAMIDGADLALAIVERPGDIEAAFASYEATMFPRGEAAAAASAANLDLAFQPNAPQGLVDLFAGYLAEA
jgi:2-polyprenyl-6-methoxyphenol hydroxylase-like FAD-dependent oxidoreductase